MTNIHDLEETLGLLSNDICGNCGREIEPGPCPYCGFEYRADEDQNGIYYY